MSLTEAEAPQAIVAPNYFFLEVTNHCNMHCTFCPSDHLQKDRRMVEEDHAIRFIEQVRDLGTGRAIQLNVLGEPLLNKQIFRYIELCKTYGIEVIVITNISILDGDRLRRVLEHDNVVLVLSLQTPTQESYDRMRGYRKLDFERYFALVEEAIETKFALGSRVRIELHVASIAHMKADSTIASEVPLDMWDVFRSPEEQGAFVTRLLDRFDAQARRLQAAHPEFYARERDWSLARFEREIASGLITTARDALPPDAATLTEHRFWGHMFAPDCFLRFKTFGMWTKGRAFLDASLPKDAFAYTEPRTEALDCELAHNVSMLADGQLSLCCLDYEGEMGFPKITEQPLAELLADPRRNAIARDAMQAEVCRRCQGNMFVFRTDESADAEQDITGFGRGFHGFETELAHEGGRWTTDRAWAYVFARIDAAALALRCWSVQPASTRFAITVGEYDPDTDTFREDAPVAFALPNHEATTIAVPFRFRRGRFYRLEIRSPVFVPRDVYGTADERELGLAVLDLRMRRAPAERTIVPTRWQRLWTGLRRVSDDRRI